MQILFEMHVCHIRHMHRIKFDDFIEWKSRKNIIIPQILSWFTLPLFLSHSSQFKLMSAYALMDISYSCAIKRRFLFQLSQLEILCGASALCDSPKYQMHFLNL